MIRPVLLLAVACTAPGACAQGSEPLALSCAVCHGTPDAPSAMPNFYGRPAAWIAQQLRDFGDGTREGTAMPRLMLTLTDAQIESLAARFGRDAEAAAP